MTSRMDRLSLGFRWGQSNQAHIPALLFASSVVLGKPPFQSVKCIQMVWHLNEIMQVKHQGQCLDLNYLYIFKRKKKIFGNVLLGKFPI